MSTLPECLQQLRHQPLALAVHIGAGSTGQLDHYADLSPARLVLVEGDLDASHELKAVAAGRPGVEVIAQPVSTAGQALTWRRHNLRTLNGPVSTAALASCYPRLRELGTQPVTSVPVAALIDALAPDVMPNSLLVLDVPGQEHELLCALGPQRVQRFSHVIVRGLHAGLGFGQPLEQALAWLRQAHFTFEREHQSGQLWHAALGRFDAQALQVKTLREQLALAQAQLDDQAERAARQEQALQVALHEAQVQHRRELADLERRLAEAGDSAHAAAQAQLALAQTGLEEQAERAARQEQALQVALHEAQAQHRHELADLERRLASEAAIAHASAQAWQAERAQLQAALAEACKTRDQEHHWHQENAKWARGLDQQLKTLQSAHAEEMARLEAALAELEQARRALHESGQQRAALADDLNQAGQRLATLEAQHADQVLQAEQQALEVERLTAVGEEARAELARTRTHLQEVAADRDAQARWHLDHAARARQLQGELEAAVADAKALRSELDAARHERDGLITGTDQLRKERDTEAHWHHENAKWAKGLKAELDALKPELDRCRQERDASAKEAHGTRAQLEQLQHELQDRDARQRLMDSEILRAEAQLDLIKEVLIREKNF